MPRNPVPRNPAREVGIVNPAWIQDHEVKHESWLERRFIMSALSCPVVIEIESQPIEIYLGPNGTERYTPDFRVTYLNKDSVIVEVKPEKFLPENAVRLKRAEGKLRGEGQKFMTVTDAVIDASGLPARAVLLMRYGRLQFSPSQALECMRLLREECNGSSSVRGLMDKGVSEALIWNLVAQHKLRVPLGLNIDPAETVFINELVEDCHDYFCTWLGVAKG